MKRRIKHIYHTLASGALLAVLSVALWGCSREPIEAPQSVRGGSGELVQVSFRACVDDVQTRAGFVPNYGVNETTGDVDWTLGEKFQWQAGDQISLFVDRLGRGPNKEEYTQFTIDKIDGNVATFTGSIPAECLGQKKNIYALSPFERYCTNYDIFVPEKLFIRNDNYSMYMWAKLENFDIPTDGNLSGAVLNFRHLTSLLRFHVKNTDTKGNTYTVVSIQLTEQGSNKHIYRLLQADVTGVDPRLKPYDDASPVGSVKMNIGSSPLGLNKWVDYSLSIPPQTPRTAVGDKLIVGLIVKDQNGNYLSRKIEIDHTSPLLQKGFEAGQRYYFNIAINSDNLSGGLEEDIIEVSAPGTLIVLPGTKKITVTGELNKVDFETIAAAANNSTLREVDLSGATVTGSCNANFSSSPITTFIFPKYMEDLPYFYNNSLTGSLIIPEGVKRIENNAFKRTKLSGTLEIPGSCETIGREAFGECKFTSLKLNEGLKTIEAGAFKVGLLTGTLTIPSTVESIGRNAFMQSDDTPDFTYVKILRTESVITIIMDDRYPSYLDFPPFLTGIYPPNYTTTTIYVPIALLDAYKNDATWNRWGAYNFIGYDANGNPVEEEPEQKLAEVGDYFYSDGSYSTAYNSSKTCVGVVIWKKPDNAKIGRIMSLDEGAGDHTAAKAWVSAKPLPQGMSWGAPLMSDYWEIYKTWNGSYDGTVNATARAAFDKRLTDAGSPAISLVGYWSSDLNQAYYQYFDFALNKNVSYFSGAQSRLVRTTATFTTK